MKLRALVLVAFVITACPPVQSTPDAGGKAPVLTSLTPTSGPLSGGTSVTLNGTNFVQGTTVTFGQTIVVPTFENERRLTAMTPAAQTPGPVSVTVVNPDGRTSTLTSAFTYSSGGETKTIAEAILRSDAETTDTSGSASVRVTVEAHVEVPRLTAGVGRGLGVRGQVGFSTTVNATPTSDDFTWVEATYTGDVDSATGGDQSRDVYAGTVDLAAPSTGNRAVYFLAARFSVDDGQTWTMADRDGIANGFTTQQLAQVVLTRSLVDWCKLGGELVEDPQTVTRRGTLTGPIIYGQVYKANITTSAGAGTGIKGGLGYGPAGSDPSTWTWVDAQFNTDKAGGANDEFQAELPNPGTGMWKFAFRFNYADGPWTYCDANGTAVDGFTEAQAGTLTVAAVGIDSCTLHFPPALVTREGRPSDVVYGRVYVQGLTEASGAATGIEAQLGYGAPTVTPSDPSWNWSAQGTFNIDDSGGGEEYSARLTGPVPGHWVYAYRFRFLGGAWTYCDGDGSTNGIQRSELGALTAESFDVTNCILEPSTAQQTLVVDAFSQPYSALVVVPTLTDALGQGTPLSVQIGMGAPGSDPSTWTGWADASYFDDAILADRYTAVLKAPAVVGNNVVAYRVQVGTNQPVYCDTDGSHNGFQQAQAGRLNAVNTVIQSCRLNTVSAFSVASGDPLQIGVRVLLPGVSAQPGASPDLSVQVGVGPQGDNASLSMLWGWANAPFARDVSMTGEDEYLVTTYPAYTGMRAVSARASLDGVSWTYCDINGSDINGYEISQQYDVLVGNHVEFDFCNTQSPASATAGTAIYGQIYEPGLTPNGSSPFTVQLGVGKETEDPGFSWNWQPASFNVLAGNNNEYQALLPDAGTGSRYAFRYTRDAGLWCYGDLDGSQNGFSGGTNIGQFAP